MNAIIPRTPVQIRVATMADLSFIDALQKKNSKCVGFLRTVSLQQKIDAGQVLVAETMSDERGTMNGDRTTSDGCGLTSSFIVPTSSFPLGYVISTDRYMKHENVGIIYQLNVVPEYRRSLVGAALIQAVFDRAAYGCRLFCCWCAQDIEANRFWKSIGFIPLAFRTGGVGTLRRGSGRARTHIFWQKRVRADDCETPYWFPSETSAGALGEGRIVLPIPPGTHWSDAKPVVLPNGNDEVGTMNDERKALPGPKRARKSKAAVPNPRDCRLGGLRLQPVEIVPVRKEKPARAKRSKRKNDPRHVAAARELNARYLEHYNAGAFEGDALPQAKYAVARQIESATGAAPLLALPPAA